MSKINNGKVFWNSHELPDDFTLLMRNLAPARKMNVKQLYQQQQVVVKPTNKSHGSKSKKPKKLSKKQLIIQENEQRKQSKQTESDLQKLDCFRKEEGNDYERWLSYLHMELVRVKMKLCAIQKALDANDGNTILELALQIPKPCKELISELKASSKSKKKSKPTTGALSIKWSSDDYHVYTRAINIIKSISVQSYQLKHLGNRLAPLDFYNYHGFTLDPWQLDVLGKINQDESVLVCAPTSSGKTVLSTYFATLNKKVLYVVPSKPLAFQVAALLHQIVGEGVGIFVDDFSYIPTTGLVIAIGTPYQIETQLPKLGNFDLAVFDEIHNLNRTGGDSYERIIKWHSGNFLALSATIHNPNTIVEWWRTIKPKLTISVVEYCHRFINIQRHLWNTQTNQIKHLNPLSCLEVSDFKNGTAGTSFTPYDAYSVWEKLESLFGESDSDSDSESDTNSKDDTLTGGNVHCPKIDISHLEPEQFFQNNKRISLDDVRNYEGALKEFIGKLPDKTIQDILQDSYLDDTELSSSEVNLTKFMSELRNNKMLPAITFNTQPGACRNMFRTLILGLEQDEQQRYPYHYDDLVYRAKLYKNYQTRKDKIQRDTVEKDLEQVMMSFEKQELATYQKNITDNYLKNCDKAKNRLRRPEGKKKIIGGDGFIGDWSQPEVDRILLNLRKEYNKIISANIIENTDLFEKHVEYCFSLTPMKANQIRQIRKTIAKKTGLKIDYTNPLIQGLKRGIGLYVNDLPDAYLRIVQELAQNRELGVVISDESLALGINMPFKTSVIMGWQGYHSVGSLLYQQMAGRAGRRGYDNEGHVVFANVHWKSMMKSTLESVQGIAEIPTCYSVLGKAYPKYKSQLEKLNNGYLSNYQSTGLEVDQGLVLQDSDQYPIEPELLSLMWKLRRYGDKVISFMDGIDQIEMVLKSSDQCRSLTRKAYYCYLFILSNLVDSLVTGVPGATVEQCLENTDIVIESLSEESQTIMRILTDNSVLYQTEHEIRYRLVKIILEVGDIAKQCVNSLYMTHYCQTVYRLMLHCFQTSHRLVFEANDFTGS
jgi:hypothetical protein